MGEKHWLGYYLSLLARGEGEREMGRTRRSNGRVHTPLHHVFCFVSVIEMLGPGRSSCGVDDVGTVARIDLVQCIWKTSMEGHDMNGRLPVSG